MQHPLACGDSADVLVFIPRQTGRGTLLQHRIAADFADHPVAIAGLTTPQSLFVLERLAWDVGMRVTERDADTTAQLVRWFIDLPSTREPLL